MTNNCWRRKFRKRIEIWRQTHSKLSYLTLNLSAQCNYNPLTNSLTFSFLTFPAVSNFFLFFFSSSNRELCAEENLMLNRRDDFSKLYWEMKNSQAKKMIINTQALLFIFMLASLFFFFAGSISQVREKLLISDRYHYCLLIEW